MYNKIIKTIKTTIIDSQAGPYPRARLSAGEPLGRFGPGNDLSPGGMDTHTIHTVQNGDTPLLCGGESHYEKYDHLGKLWKEPIIEIISANNEKLKILKDVISDEHLMANDILPDAKSIISFFIPFQENIVKSNIEGIVASEDWAIAYIKTNDLIKTINDKIEILMEQNGYKAGKIPATHNFDVKKLISNWSHRHIAYIAGIGTFGMNNMLITKNGCCGRFGSIIINYELNEYKKTKEIKEKCLYKINGSCGICQKKCIVNAYENNKYDRHKCYKQCLENVKHHKKIGYADICGKCLVGLPCSTKEP